MSDVLLQNRWSYDTWTSWKALPNEQLPILIYFKETQSNPEGQIVSNSAAESSWLQLCQLHLLWHACAFLLTSATIAVAALYSLRS